MAELRIEGDSDELNELYKELRNLGGTEQVRRIREAGPGGQGEPITTAILVGLAVDLTIKAGEAVIRWYRKRHEKRPRLVLVDSGGRSHEVTADNLMAALEKIAES